MPGRLRYLQLFGDAIIPLLGFFLWNWSLYFILLYYLLDIFMSELLTHLKTQKIVSHKGNQGVKSWIGYGFFSFSLFVLSTFLIHLAVYLTHPGINFVREIIAFWNYEEMGIKQGYVLLPIMALATYQRYKLEFLFPGFFKVIKTRDLWLKHLQQYPAIVAGTGLAIGVNYFIHLADVYYLMAIVLLNGLYRYFVSRRPV